MFEIKSNQDRVVGKRFVGTDGIGMSRFRNWNVISKWTGPVLHMHEGGSSGWFGAIIRRRYRVILTIYLRIL